MTVPIVRVDWQARLRFPAYSATGLAGTSSSPKSAKYRRGKGKCESFFEVHAENYMGSGGPPHRALERIRSDHPISLHGVCMSIGGVEE